MPWLTKKSLSSFDTQHVFEDYVFLGKCLILVSDEGPRKPHYFRRNASTSPLPVARKPIPVLNTYVA